MQDARSCFILQQSVISACKIVDRRLGLCHCLTACCTWRPLYSRSCTGCTKNSLQRVQGSWADLGSKSFYSESDIVVLLPAASQQPLGHARS